MMMIMAIRNDNELIKYANLVKISFNCHQVIYIYMYLCMHVYVNRRQTLRFIHRHLRLKGGNFLLTVQFPALPDSQDSLQSWGAPPFRRLVVVSLLGIRVPESPLDSWKEPRDSMASLGFLPSFPCLVESNHVADLLIQSDPFYLLRSDFCRNLEEVAPKARGFPRTQGVTLLPLLP